MDGEERRRSALRPRWRLRGRPGERAGLLTTLHSIGTSCTIRDELESLRLQHSAQQLHDLRTRHRYRCLERHALSLPHRAEDHRPIEVARQGLNGGADIDVHQTDGDAVPTGNDGRVLLRTSSRGRRRPTHDGHCRNNEGSHCHARRTASFHVVSIPLILTVSLVIERMRRPLTVSPRLTSTLPCRPGRPSSSASHGGPPTIPVTANGGRGGRGGCAGALSMVGLYETGDGRRSRRKGSLATTTSAAARRSSGGSRTPARGAGNADCDTLSGLVVATRRARTTATIASDNATIQRPIST